MAKSGLAYRKAVRVLRSQSLGSQVLAAAVAVTLVAGILSAIGRGTSSDTTHASTHVASGRHDSTQPGSSGPGDTSAGATGTTVAGGAGGSTPGGGGNGPGGTAGGGGGATSGPGAGPATATPPPATLCGDEQQHFTNLKASDRGVTANKVKVVFPWFDPTAAFALTGSQQSKPENQPDFVQAYVDCINAAGGINGRMIDPIIQIFNPLDDTTMDALCKKWTEDDKVFAVVDSAGWFGQHQLCLAQDHQTPLVSGWTTVDDWTARGAPYLWWTAPSANADIENLVLWAKERGELTPTTRLGIVASDRPSDKLAFDVLKSAIQKAGLKLAVPPQLITYDRQQAVASATIAVGKMKGKVDVLLPLLPFDTFAFWLQSAENQDFYPKYLLSDFEQELVVADALLGMQYKKSLQHAHGPTFARLGTGANLEEHYPVQYGPAEIRCVQIWRRAHPTATALQIAGVNMRWCDSMSLFFKAARRAGANLTRLGWANAMATIHDEPTTMTPTMTFGPGRYAGPTQMKVIDVQTSGCKPPYQDEDNTCTVQLEGYGPIRRF